MRKTKLALLACRKPGEGPWIYAQGNESELKITGLVVGERIELKMTVGDLRDSAWFSSPGTHPIPFKRMERFQVIKHADDGVTLAVTNVEVVFNGASQGVSG